MSPPRHMSKQRAQKSTTRTGDPRALELLRAKLDVPPPRPGLVERTALVGRLSRERNGRVVSVVAPPGYGKTTLLGQWAAHDRREFAWVSLDHRDNDPVVFLTYVAEALNADSTLEPAVFKALRGTGDSLWARGLPRLVAALAARPEPFVLVLDDVHELENHECLDALAALLLHVPRGSLLVLSGRTEARQGLPKLRADGELLELGPAELALNDAEAHALLMAAGADVTEAQAHALNERAEGWAAGLYLAALSLDDGSSSVGSFGGDDRFVTDYLRAEELNRVAPAQLEFLLRTSVLESMCGPLCDAVLERDDSAQMLEQLERQNLFVVALDHQRRWFRYHHLFREMLQAELGRREPELPAALNRRAASWCNANGQPDVAIEYSVAAGDTDEVAKLVGALAGTYYRSGRVTTVERWLAHFDDSDLLERYPAVAVLGVWVHALRGRPEAAERWALAVETSRSKDTMPDGSPLETWAATVRALLCRKGVEQMRIDAELALSGLPVTSQWYPVAIVLRGMAVLFSGDADERRPSWVMPRTRPSPEARPGPAWLRARNWRSSHWSETISPRQSRSCPGERVRRRRAVDGLRRNRDPAGSHSAARNRQGARRPSPNNARGCPADTPAADARAVLVRGACPARAREGASGLVGRTWRGHALSRGRRTSFAGNPRSAHS